MRTGSIPTAAASAFSLSSQEAYHAACRSSAGLFAALPRNLRRVVRPEQSRAVGATALPRQSGLPFPSHCHRASRGFQRCPCRQDRQRPRRQSGGSLSPSLPRPSAAYRSSRSHLHLRRPALRPPPQAAPRPRWHAVHRQRGSCPRRNRCPASLSRKCSASVVHFSIGSETQARPTDPQQADLVDSAGLLCDAAPAISTIKARSVHARAESKGLMRSPFVAGRAARIGSMIGNPPTITPQSRVLCQNCTWQ